MPETIDITPKGVRENPKRVNDATVAFENADDALKRLTLEFVREFHGELVAWANRLDGDDKEMALDLLRRIREQESVVDRTQKEFLNAIAGK